MIYSRRTDLTKLHNRIYKLPFVKTITSCIDSAVSFFGILSGVPPTAEFMVARAFDVFIALSSGDTWLVHSRRKRKFWRKKMRATTQMNFEPISPSDGLIDLSAK
jgi:hypothetical protein